MMRETFDTLRPAATLPQAAGQMVLSTARIKYHLAEFVAKVAQCEADLAAGRLDEAMMHASLAAAVAVHNHCGVFASERLERVIHSLSAKIPDDAATFTRASSAKGYKRVLHVASEVAATGGVTRMISRWITADKSRSNSILITRFRGLVPEHMKSAVAQSGGAITLLNTKIGSQRDWVRRLRRIAREYDVVVLHIHCEDVIPLVAFAQPHKIPPVLFLNHADHIFWLGASVGHLVINLRDAASEIAVDRRGVPAERSILMPTTVDPTVRKLSRIDARAQLGLPTEGSLLVSIARGAKYRKFNGMTFADMHVELLKKHPDARLVVVGPGSPADWKRAQDAVGGRIIGLPEQPDPWRYFEAADIYVDSFPFVSSTSMMEAAGYGLPLVSLFTAPDEARIFGINHVGLVGSAYVARSLSEYDATLSRLIANPAQREQAGTAAEQGVRNAHVMPAWLAWMEKVYDRAVELPPIASPPGIMSNTPDTPRFGEPDCRHGDIFGVDLSDHEMIRDYMGMLALPARLRVWNRLRRIRQLRGPAEHVRLLLPEWLKSRMRR